ncbi:MAG: hypothetical protein V3S85_01690 [Nitrospirales bacterium]
MPPQGISSTHQDFLKNKQTKSILATGTDIQILGILFLVSGVIDFIWILAYPEYALKVFGTTFGGWMGLFVKFQHPLIHWMIGYGFLKRRRWAFWAYLVYLAMACVSETINQFVYGYHQARTTMIILSLLFGTYIVARRKAFQPTN